MKIAHIFPHYGLNGMERYVSYLNFGLLKLNKDIRIYNFVVTNKGIDYKKIWHSVTHPNLYYKVIETDMGIKLDYDILSHCSNSEMEREFSRFLKEVNPDVVNFQHLSDMGASLIQLARKHGIKTIVTLHDYWFICPRNFLISRDLKLCQGPDGGRRCVECIGITNEHTDLNTHIERYHFMKSILTNDVDKIITVSNAMKSKLIEEGVPESKIQNIYAGIEADYARIKVEENSGAEMNFGFIGNVSPIKGVHVLIDAFKKANVPNSKLFIYGTIDQLYKQDLLQLSKDEQNICFKGSYTSSDLPEIFSSIDALIVPTVCSEQPLVVLEALRYKVPVIASDIGGIPEYLNFNQEALFEAGNSEELADKLQLIYKDPNFLQRLKDWIPGVKSIEQFVRDVYEVYSYLLGFTSKKSKVNFQHLQLLSENSKYFSRKDTVPRQFIKILDFLKRNNIGKISIFGSGIIGKRIASYLEKKEFEVVCLFDNDKNKWGREEGGFKIFPPSSIKTLNELECILITSDWETEIINQLSEMELEIPYIGLYTFSENSRS